MTFTYESHPQSLKLNIEEEFLLASADEFVYFLPNGCKSIGELHNNITVVVSDCHKIENHTFSINGADAGLLIQELKVAIDKLEGELNEFHDNMDLPYDVKVKQNRLNGLRTLLAKLQSRRYVSGNLAITETTEKLGEYDSPSKTVYLYIENIRRQAYAFKELIAYVYIHEMMHALYDVSSHKTDPVIEEPIVEYSTLKYLESFKNGCYLDESSLFVLDKQYSFTKNYYGFGYYLFNDNVINWMQLYYSTKECGLINDDLYKHYFPHEVNRPNPFRLPKRYIGLYPFKEEACCYESLLYALTHTRIRRKTKVYFPDDIACYISDIYGFMSRFFCSLDDRRFKQMSLSISPHSTTGTMWLHSGESNCGIVGNKNVKSQYPDAFQNECFMINGEVYYFMSSKFFNILGKHGNKIDEVYNERALPHMLDEIINNVLMEDIDGSWEFRLSQGLFKNVIVLYGGNVLLNEEEKIHIGDIA